MYSEEDYLQLSGIQHYVYCPKQWALIHMEQVWSDDARTVKGNIFHKNVDNPEYSEKRKTRLIRRSVPVSSSFLGISGKCDVVEFKIVEGFDNPICLYPIEYKIGRNKLGLEDKAQLCAEAICLEEMYGITIPFAFLYYGTERRRTKVELSDELRQVVYETVKQMHMHMHNKSIPIVYHNQKCKNCSLINLCMPLKKVDKNMRQYLNEI